MRIIFYTVLRFSFYFSHLTMDMIGLMNAPTQKEQNIVEQRSRNIESYKILSIANQGICFNYNN